MSWKIVLRLGAPLGMTALSLVHPIPVAGDIVGTLGPCLIRWQVVHVVLLGLFPAVAIAAYWLVPAEATLERTIARVAFGIFVVSTTAFDAVVGLGTGHLVGVASRDLADVAVVQAYWASRISDPAILTVYAGTALGWLVGIGAIVVALVRVLKAWLPAALLLPACALAFDHTPPFGPVAMVGLFGATVWSLAQKNTGTPVIQPIPIASSDTVTRATAR